MEVDGGHIRAELGSIISGLRKQTCTLWYCKKERYLLSKNQNVTWPLENTVLPSFCSL